MLSRMVYARVRFPERRLTDIAGSIEEQLKTAGFGGKCKPGAKIAIGVGSRGIANIATIVRAVVDYWKSRGFSPFIFPAMGSHGAATAEGQADVLAHYGIHEATMGCPVVSQLEVVPLGRTADGIEAYLDKQAYESDGVFLIGRVKWHTDFSGKIESGLFKMMAIGLGKFAGAKQYHTFAYKLGLESVIRQVGRQVLSSGKVLGGLAILEDAYHNTAKLEAIPVERMEQREQELQALVKEWMPRLPANLDLLMIDEIGKNFSGTGMDTKIVNRGIHGERNPWPATPLIDRIYLRDLSSLSHGNAVGVGMADVIHKRLLDKIDWNPTYINSLTGTSSVGAKAPMHFRSDRECMENMSRLVGRLNTEDMTIGWIANTLDLSPLAVSENLRPALAGNPNVEIVGEAWELPFDANGDLSPLFTHPAMQAEGLAPAAAAVH